jgi:hypothetical protein
MYIMKKGYTEPFFDFRNITSWEEIPLRLPDQDMIITSRSYIGDPFLNENSTGTIMNKATLVWTIPFTEMSEGGLEFPIDPEEFQIFAVSYHIVSYMETGQLAERYVVTDTAGLGALDVGTIDPQENSTGGSSSTFGDFARPTNILVIVGILVVLIIFGVAGVVLVRRQMKEKKEKEKEFIEHIEKLKAEGKDPFGKELEGDDTKKEVSYESLYGSPQPDGYKKADSSVTPSTLPGPGLGKPVESESHIEEMELKKS